MLFVCLYCSRQSIGGWWERKDNAGGCTWRGYSSCSHRDTTKEDCSGDSNPFSGLVKVKVHRAEPANERADGLADKAMSDPKVGKEWCQRTNRAVFKWEKPCREAGKWIYQDRHSTFNNSVRDAIRRGTAENEVQTQEERLTGAWRQMSTPRRQKKEGVKMII